jgi:hypothetical protein
MVATHGEIGVGTERPFGLNVMRHIFFLRSPVDNGCEFLSLIRKCSPLSSTGRDHRARIRLLESASLPVVWPLTAGSSCRFRSQKENKGNVHQEERKQQRKAVSPASFRPPPPPSYPSMFHHRSEGGGGGGTATTPRCGAPIDYTCFV